MGGYITYKLLLNNILIDQKMIEDIKILNIFNEIEFENNKEQIELDFKLKIFLKDNDNISNDILKNIFNLRDNIFDIEFNVDNNKFKYSKMYIKSITQSYSDNIASIKLKINQKFLGDKKGMSLND